MGGFGFGFGAFAIGGACGVAAVVAGALSVKPPPAPVRDQVVPAESGVPHTTPPPKATSAESDSGSAGALGPVDPSKILVETGAPNPYSWYRWHLIKRDVTRSRVKDLLGDPSARRGGSEEFWDYSKQPGVESSSAMHLVRFNGDLVSEWECNYINNEVNHRPDLFGDSTRWFPLRAGSTLAEVISALGEPTRYLTRFDNRQQVRVARLEYRRHCVTLCNLNKLVR